MEVLPRVASAREVLLRGAPRGDERRDLDRPNRHVLQRLMKRYGLQAQD